MKNFTLIKKLQEIESDILAFSDDLNQDVLDNLKMDFNEILNKLYKKITYKYESPEDVIKAAIKLLKYKPDFHINKSRKRYDYILPRQYIQVICRHLYRHKSLEYVGKFFPANPDHSTIIHSVKTIKNQYETDIGIRKDFGNVQKKLLGRICINFDRL